MIKFIVKYGMKFIIDIVVIFLILGAIKFLLNLFNITSGIPMFIFSMIAIWILLARNDSFFKKFGG